jgi:hypothetical protein
MVIAALQEIAEGLVLRPPLAIERPEMDEGCLREVIAVHDRGPGLKFMDDAFNPGHQPGDKGVKFIDIRPAVLGRRIHPDDVKPRQRMAPVNQR